MPRPIIYAIVIGGLILLIPLAFAFQMRYSKSPEPPYSWHQDMMVQPRFNAQSDTMFYSPDGVNPGPAMRPRVAGTVARGELWNTLEQSPYYRGVEFHDTPDGEGKAFAFAEGLPPRVVAAADEDFLQRGKERFEIFCAACHSVAGDGDGIVQRWMERETLLRRGVAPLGPANLTDPTLTESMIQRAAQDFWIDAERQPERLPQPEELFGLPFYQQRVAELYAAHETQAGEPLESAELAVAVRELYGEARLDSYAYTVIRDGYGNMGPFGSQVFPEDRWAIVLYLRALRAAGDERYRATLIEMIESDEAPIGVE